MKHPQVSPLIAEIERVFGNLDGVEVKWHDGRVYRCIKGRWVEVVE